jgi:phosphate transport system protein
MDNEPAKRQHICKRFDRELEDIRNRALTMGGLVERQVEEALKSILSNDVELGERVILNDISVNALEVSIDEECTQILVRRQPAAVDLRVVVAVIKTITDLERIGDEAKRISRQAIDMAGHYCKKNQFLDLQHLGRHVIQLLHKSLDAFARLDVDLALDAVQEDRKVDSVYESIIRQQMTYMMEDPRTIPASIDIMWAARALERVGDRACNICEYVIYQVKGKDVRHTKLEDLESEFKTQ